MGIKSFFIKKMLKSKLKGVPEDQIDALIKRIEDDPTMMQKMKDLEKNKPVKDLLEKVQKEIEEKVAGGMNPEMAQMAVMMKYQAEFMKHREALEPLAMLMQQ